ncbi:MAG: histidine phosphatase family protein [Acidobacteriota bacterium]|nr:MAG: histidine phosphatase family protein [Acidobacteriota bacterium]
MKKLILVRHGLTDWNENGRLMGRSDVEINARGQTQAERVAQALAPRAIDAIYSSPQVRARQTATPLAEAARKDVVVETDFDEVWLSDAWKGKTVTELRGDEDLERTIENPTYRSNAIEPLAEVQARTVASIERLRELHAGGTIVVVSHGDPLRVIVAHYLGLDLSVFRRLACDNGSVSEIVFNRRGPRLEILNWSP